MCNPDIQCLIDEMNLLHPDDIRELAKFIRHIKYRREVVLRGDIECTSEPRASPLDQAR